MDKYEYNLKLEEIDKLVDQGDYKEAANLADTIEWRRVRNVRTLCLISEIYEAAEELDKSKEMLVRAYRRSPVGRNVLYRLVEVTTALGQYDEALEYYSEYVQAAPHDNNRYILKYMIYKGRGSSVEDLIAILEEYLGQEYTERWAYELAALYQQAGQMQKCMATCDDLVLWFHTGKYVKKALDLKKRYAALTPKQQQIYEVCLQEEAQSEYFEGDDEEPTVVQNKENPDDEVIAENIIAETEKEIADEITARKAEREKNTEAEIKAEPVNETEAKQQTKVLQRVRGVHPLSFLNSKKADRNNTARPEPDREPEKAEPEEEPKDTKDIKNKNDTKGNTSSEKTDYEGQEEEKSVNRQASFSQPEVESVESDLTEFSYEEPEIPEEPENDDLQIQLARSVRKVISGVARKPELNEDDVPAAVEERLRTIQEVSRRREPEPVAGKLSIDDILLSMEEKGRQTAAAARNQGETEASAEQQSASEEVKPVLSEEESAIEEAKAEVPKKEAVIEEAKAEVPEKEAVIEEAKVKVPEKESVEEKTKAEAPEKESNIKTSKSKISVKAVVQDDEENSLPPTSRSVAAAATEDLTPEELEALRYSSNPAKFLKNRTSLPSYTEEPAAEEPAAEDLGMTRRIVNTKEELLEAARKELMESKTIRIPSEEVIRAYANSQKNVVEEEMIMDESSSVPDRNESSETEHSTPEQEKETQHNVPEQGDMTQQRISVEPEEPKEENAGFEGNESLEEREDLEEGEGLEEREGLEEKEGFEEDFEEGEYFDDPLTIAPHLKGLFKGFTEIEGLEDQIANAILQALAKGEDRTSRTGNILIFGPHGSGKTTLAVSIAKAIAQEKGRQVAKMARIYAADLNRRDIAATIAKIAGGTLIVEEAGDLDDNTVEQLTTAMEFRTDGLVVILEDEQRYVHDLLMKHPRFTMKFTAQVYLPVYTTDELEMFAGQHAREQDYMISEEGYEVIRQKVADAASTETPMSVADVIALVDGAIRRSNKFMRKMSMGKKRYDENDYVLLFARDFK